MELSNTDSRGDYMFKIGDRVKPKEPKWKHGVGEIIKINEVEALSTEQTLSSDREHWIWVEVEYTTFSCVVCNDASCGYAVKSKWHKPKNIELVYAKNEQLLFNFMNEE